MHVYSIYHFSFRWTPLTKSGNAPWGGGDLLTHVINRYRDLVISPEISQLVSYNKRYKVVNVFDVDITLAIASDTYDRIT